ncbi:hypothetical protein Nepgr_028741 [Nepenthes gracilis]|uniref:Uncharacterized protein n=1 Tax=Nepenthes gracilis TaxID=150966 RepID=A0AAD3TBB0_NEPGR|nr:hypothetical protein Nepgr_028741 [Nepenthes gracilis]
MFSSKLLLTLFAVLSALVAIAAGEDYLGYNCSDQHGSYTNQSTYGANLNTLLSSISSGTEIDSSFYNSSVGQDASDIVYATAMCRGDVTLDDCRRCLNGSTRDIRRLCPRQKEAVIWYDDCTLRYSDRNIFGTLESDPTDFTCDPIDPNIVTDFLSLFNQHLGKRMRSLKEKAASDNSGLKFATGDSAVTDFLIIYGLVQCSPDLTSQYCKDCVEDAIHLIPRCVNGTKGGRILKPSCNIRYSTSKFYNWDSGAPRPPLPTATFPSPATGLGERNNTSKNVIIVAFGVVSAVLITIILCLLRRGTMATNVQSQLTDVDHILAPSSIAEAEGEIGSFGSLQYDFETVRMATDNFSEANKLGQGGFGVVYKGRLFGHHIAVKRLSAGNSEQGEPEFKNEVMLVAKLRHRNLVRLLGFCLGEGERLLIYEFMPNLSLDCFLLEPIKRASLNWEKRYIIVKGIARGLLYLHEDSPLRIIHRDLKISNVLLDGNMNPKISDFGMARLFQVDQTQGDASRIAGTCGYMAPEYALYGSFSTKSDVYSFGVIVLEIVSGQRNCGFHYGENVEGLVSTVWQNWSEGKALRIVDPMLLTSDSKEEVIRCIHIGLLCVQENAADRPTMSSVVLMLSGSHFALPQPLQPAFTMRRPAMATDMISSTDYKSRDGELFPSESSSSMKYNS